MKRLQIIGDDIYYDGVKVAEITVKESSLRSSFEDYFGLVLDVWLDEGEES